MNQPELWRIEKQLWLGDAGFFERTLATKARMVLPQPAGVMDRAATLQSIAAAPRWRDVIFSDQFEHLPTSNTAILIYLAQADRGSRDSAYSAQCSSTYVRSPDGWQLVLHHQSPIGTND